MRPTRHGFTLIELLVVISIIATLAGLLIPAIVHVKALADQAACGNNQQQILTAMLTYSHERGGGWPVGDATSDIAAATTPDAARRITERGFEVLAATLELPNALFKCRAQSAAGPVIRPRSAPTDDAWGGGRVSYAFDYAAPVEGSPVRVLIADRSIKAHNGTVVAGFSDGHVQPLGWNKGDRGADQTAGVIETTKPIYNPDAIGADGAAETDLTPDNIYDFDGDVAPGTVGTPYYGNGSGSSRRCFLK